MHTLLSRDPKREMDSEISYVSHWHSVFFYDLPKNSPLFFGQDSASRTSLSRLTLIRFKIEIAIF